MSFNQIGGTAAGAGNLVEQNGTGGIAIFGNPVSASGQPNIGNSILGNSVFLNGRSDPYDVSKFDGITFWARANVPGVLVKVSVPDSGSAADL